MRVRGTDGDLGIVGEVVGEEATDIFRGVTLSQGLFNTDLFLPGEHIRAVEDGAVYVNLTQAQARALHEAGAAPATGAAT